MYTAVTPFDPTAPLEIDTGAAGEIADWLRLVGDALARFSADHADESPSIAQLWPEHFDLAISMGEANYGGSPPDDDIAAPYLYVGPWKPRAGEFWTEPFGASLVRRDGMDVDDAVALFEDGHRHLGTDPLTDGRARGSRFLQRLRQRSARTSDANARAACSCNGGRSSGSNQRASTISGDDGLTRSASASSSGRARTTNST